MRTLYHERVSIYKNGQIHDTLLKTLKVVLRL